MLNILETYEIHKAFGDVRVLNGVSFTMKRGSVYTLIGSNGSGKTTLINVLSGFIKPDKGSVVLKGMKISQFLPFKVSRLGIGRTFQDLRLATQMTVYENVLMALERKAFGHQNIEQRKRVDGVLKIVSLSEKRDELAGDISYGQQKLLTIGCCIACNADLLLFDEPVSGIDEVNRRKIAELVEHLKGEGKTILQIEHNSSYIERTSDCIMHMEKGVLCLA